MDREILFVVGAARSGTTMLADQILSRYPGVRYTGEIDFLWRYGQAFRGHDIRQKGAESHKRYIVDWFDWFGARSGGDLIVDKTPSNVLRIHWLKEVFPQAKIVHVIRDGRAVALSARREWLGVSSTALDSEKYRAMGSFDKVRNLTGRKLRLSQRVRDLRSAVEMTADVGKGLNAYLKALGLRREKSVWGPRVPGLKAIAKDCSVLDACAYQWDQCVHRGMCDGRQYPGDYMEIRYEELLISPQEAVARLFNFIGKELDNDLESELIRKIKRQPGSFLDNADSNDLAHLNNILHRSLNYLDYL